jgi:hypothetical protein
MRVAHCALRDRAHDGDNDDAGTANLAVPASGRGAWISM